MKRLTLALLTVLIAFSGIAYAQTPDTSDWYIYNGSSTKHSFSVNFPRDWKAITSGNDLQGFSPVEEYEKMIFSIQEFEGQTYDQAINYFKNNNVKFLESYDIVLSTPGEDLIGKEAMYFDELDDKSFSKTFIRRGSLILAISNPEEGEYRDIMEGIKSSFKFTDNWHEYIDFQEKYSFIFPKSLEINNLSDGVEIYDPGQIGDTIFSVIKYEGASAQEAAEMAEGYTEDYQSMESTIFHGINNSYKATYINDDNGKQSSKIIISSNGDSYALTDKNIESNYPHLNYYDQYLVEILEGFEFFEVDGDYHTYTHFPDVRDNHPNAISINSLKNGGIIAGYPDGTFRPDGEINRAELTKMIVETVKTPELSEYNNCFPDVKEEWFAPHICYAKEQGWVEGYPDGNFKPGAKINRVEAIKIILEVLFNDQIETETSLDDDSAMDIYIDEWYGKYFIFADNKNLLDKQHITREGDGYRFYPGGKISRKEVAESIYRSLKLLKIQ